MSCRSYLEEVHALTGSDVVCKKIIHNLFCFKTLVLIYFSSDGTTKVLENLLFGKNYTSLEFGPDLKVFRGHCHQTADYAN